MAAALPAARPRAAWRYGLVAVGFLLAWMGVDYATVRSDGALKLAPLWTYAFLTLVWAGFLWASWPLFASRSLAWRILGRGLVSAIALASWLVAGGLAVVQFHQAIGGEL